MPADKIEAGPGNPSVAASEKARARALAGQYGISLGQARELIAQHRNDQEILEQKAAKLKADRNAGKTD
ncbi:DUF3606 domain-containing protein [Mesorhizobium sp. BAC0120]|uniref:DUF3606 domain-containing protein n=1 Tax=Mesorhizobium sp. BAC0120 TaxID=3090670 RepID=UPI00298C41F2|nr:DUF3606 domain-containing protein [Mesorhizobium sp. BAC0120]MDW6023620.1 DUF3606 domain-containing protein [Mesorhizobium sp. BAC0120]